MAEELDLALGVLDHQLVDREGRRCGKVDELELEGLDGPEPHVAAIVVGVAAWRTRGRLGRIAARLARAQPLDVPWSEVAAVGAGVELRSRAADLGLGRGDERAARLVRRLPGARL